MYNNKKYYVLGLVALFAVGGIVAPTEAAEILIVSWSQTETTMFPGDTNTLTTFLRSAAEPTSALVDLEVKNLDEEVVFQKFFDNVTLTTEGQSFELHVPADLSPGIYHFSIGIFDPGWAGLINWHEAILEFVKVDQGPDTGTLTIGSSWQKNSSISEDESNQLFVYYHNHTASPVTFIGDLEIHDINGNKVHQDFGEYTISADNGLVDGISTSEELAPGRYYFSVGLFEPGWTALKQWFHRLQEFEIL